MTRDRARIFRITHVHNVAWMLDNGLHPPSSATRDPNFVAIGDQELIEKRRRRVVPIAPGGTLADYVPFYFTPFSPMLYKILTGHGGIRQHPASDIAILVSSVTHVREQGAALVITDRHAYLQAATFGNDAAGLDLIDWAVLQSRVFARSRPGGAERFERYQAEALLHGPQPITVLRAVVCYDEAQTKALRQEVERRDLTLAVATKPEWYF